MGGGDAIVVVGQPIIHWKKSPAAVPRRPHETSHTSMPEMGEAPLILETSMCGSE